MRQLLLPLLLLGSAAALTRNEVERWPLLYREAEVKQTFTAQEKASLSALIAGLNRKPEVQALKKKYPYFEGLQLAGVQFSLVAPFRSARPERLTTVQVYQGEPPVMLAVLNTGSLAWLIEPVGNMNICIWKQGYTLRDLDQNGLREVALLTSCGDGPGGASTLNLFAWLGGELRPWGDLNAYEVGPEDAANTRQRELSRTLYVQKGQVPRFAAVTREQRWAVDSAAQSQMLSRRTYVEPLTLQDSAYRVRRLW